MKTTQWMKAGIVALFCGALALASATPGYAGVTKNASIDGGCNGSCMDVWQVQCTSGQTHQVRATIRDRLIPYVNIIVTTLGYKGPQTMIGDADPEVGNKNWSAPSTILRPGDTQGKTDALVLVSVENAPYTSSYEVVFSCHNNIGTQVSNPVVKLLQNDHQ